MTKHFADVWFPWLQGPEEIMQCAEERNSLTLVLRFSEFHQGATETCVKVSHGSCFNKLVENNTRVRFSGGCRVRASLAPPVQFFFHVHAVFSKSYTKQESIPVGCVLHAFSNSGGGRFCPPSQT